MGRSVFLGIIALLGAELIGSHIRAVGLEAPAFAAPVRNHPLHPELGTGPHHGEGSLQECLVQRETVVLPQMTAIPCIGHKIVVAPCAHSAKDIVLGEAGPSRLHLPILRGGTMPVVSACHINNVIKERQMHLGEVGRLGRPVVHLHVDIGMDVTVPGGLAHIVPDALQVAGHIHTTARRNLQIASVGKVELLQEQHIRLAARHIFVRIIMAHQRIGGQLAGSLAQLEVYTPHIGSEILHMRLVYFLPSLLAGLVHTLCHRMLQLAGV